MSDTTVFYCFCSNVWTVRGSIPGGAKFSPPVRTVRVTLSHTPSPLYNIFISLSRA